MGLVVIKNILDILKDLNRYGIDVEASFVAIPKITGWDELEESIYRISEFEKYQACQDYACRV